MMQNSCDLLVNRIGPHSNWRGKPIPLKWLKKSEEGRTVWENCLEEIITQNLEKYHTEFGIDKVETSSER